MERTPAETLGDLISRESPHDPGELNSTLKTVWPLLHGPLYRHDATVLMALFKRAGYVSDSVAYPDADLTVYRGEPVSSEQHGISWTTDSQVAWKYARDYSTIGKVQVLQAVAPVEAILAQFTYEDEVVVEPNLLKEVKSLGYMPQFKLPLGGLAMGINWLSSLHLALDAISPPAIPCSLDSH